MKLFVFDLDFTLWDAGGTWCDCTTPPYKRVNGMVLDYYGANIKLYPDVNEIIDVLNQNKKQMALASRTSAPSSAKTILRLFEIDHHFAFQEIYPGSKIAHLNQLMKDTQVSANEIVFFDDEYRNIEDVSAMGIEAVWVKDGITLDMVQPYL